MPDKDLKPMWTFFQVTLQFRGPFAAAIPQDPSQILAMLQHRMPAKPPENAVPIEDLAQQVTEEVEADETPQPGHSTFKRDDDGLYYEGRCVRGHLKDCGQQVAHLFPAVKNFRAKLVNKTYVLSTKIPLGKKEPDGVEQRFIQVLTRQGPRSSFKFIDYVNDPKMTFTLQVLNDGVIKEDHLRAIFAYGGVHGMGQERGQDWGRYDLVDLKEIARNGAEVGHGDPS